MDCQNIVFSPQQSQKRINKVLRVLPPQVLKKVLFFALYLLGARLNAIASIVDMPKDSVKTTINRVMKDGLSALRDRRQSAKTYELQLPTSPQPPQVSALIEEGLCIITFGDTDHQLKIPQNHRIHLRSVLLSLQHANMLSVQTVSSILEISAAHSRELSNKLLNNDVAEVLIDQRKGQKQDILVDSSVKAELIQQFAARAVTGYSTSSQDLTEIINVSQSTNISSRTIRWHMNKLGLMKIRKTLPNLVETLKKTFDLTC
ncbi:hypothetical protein J7J63_05775 [Candidatus Bipolaricaulota bacterium]|nr:hypothetical protein [Candidatus Bipolaricaulota bacterium]